MKKLFLISLFALVAFQASAAITVTNLISLASLNGTNAGVAFSPTGTITVTPPTFLIQNAGLTDTNDFVANVQISFDNTNFVTIAVYRPSITNAATDKFAPLLSTNRVYLRVQAITTNATTVGAVAVTP